MAEIGVEKKKPVWPWIILVLVILVILYFLFMADGDSPNEPNRMNDTEQFDQRNFQDTPQDTARFETRMNDTLA